MCADGIEYRKMLGVFRKMFEYTKTTHNAIKHKDLFGQNKILQ